MEGRNPLVRLRPIVRGLFARSLTIFFKFRNLIIAGHCDTRYVVFFLFYILISVLGFPAASSRSPLRGLKLWRLFNCLLSWQHKKYVSLSLYIFFRLYSLSPSLSFSSISLLFLHSLFFLSDVSYLFSLFSLLSSLLLSLSSLSCLLLCSYEGHTYIREIPVLFF